MYVLTISRTSTKVGHVILLLQHCTSVCIEAVLRPPSLEPLEAFPWINSCLRPCPFPLSRFYCFSSFTLVALQLVSTPAAGQSADVTAPVVCGDARPLVCDGDTPSVTVSASSQQQQTPWTAQDSCTGGCYYVSYWVLEYIIPLLCGRVSW